MGFVPGEGAAIWPQERMNWPWHLGVFAEDAVVFGLLDAGMQRQCSDPVYSGGGGLQQPEKPTSHSLCRDTPSSPEPSLYLGKGWATCLIGDCMYEKEVSPVADTEHSSRCPIASQTGSVSIASQRGSISFSLTRCSLVQPPGHTAPRL